MAAASCRSQVPMRNIELIKKPLYTYLYREASLYFNWYADDTE